MELTERTLSNNKIKQFILKIDFFSNDVNTLAIHKIYMIIPYMHIGIPPKNFSYILSCLFLLSKNKNLKVNKRGIVI